MKRTFLILNCVLIALVLTSCACFTVFGGLWLKGLTSAGFVFIGILNFVYLILKKNVSLKCPSILLAGLVFAMLGDIVLNIHFIGGAVLFAIGHIFFFISYCFIAKLKWLDLICSSIIFIPAVLLITLAPFFNFGGILMELICVAYALIISFMVGKAIANFISNRCITNLIIMIGSILFFFSDLMLLLYKFGELPKIFDILCVATYYPAECLLAYSIIQMSFDKEKIDKGEKDERIKSI